jgi:hypothetical protein
VTVALHDRLVAALRSARNSDGGFGPRSGIASEPEPTAVAALALEDAQARGWLVSQQSDTGAISLQHGNVDNDSPTSLAAIALPAGAERDRALAYLESHLAVTVGPTDALPLKGNGHGFAWVRGTFGWTEPTSRAVLALRLAGRTSSAIADGVSVLNDRQCSVGGWNYGNTTVWGTDLDPYVQTTAMGAMALQGDVAVDTATRALTILKQRWRDEPGGLSLAVTLIALELHRQADPDRGALIAALTKEWNDVELLGDIVAIAWAVIATGSAWSKLQVTS